MIEFQESMTGSYRRRAERPASERSMSLTLRARVQSLLRSPSAHVEGEIDAEGLASHRRLGGTLSLALRSPDGIGYALGFFGDDGRPYVFEGNRTIHGTSWIESLSILAGSIRDEGGAVVGDVLLRFDVRSDLGRFVRSFRRTG